MLENFLSKTLHHVMVRLRKFFCSCPDFFTDSSGFCFFKGPLHALRGTCELISGRLQDQKGIEENERKEL
jgi:hypothetical protein